MTKILDHFEQTFCAQHPDSSHITVQGELSCRNKTKKQQFRGETAMREEITTDLGDEEERAKIQ